MTKDGKKRPKRKNGVDKSEKKRFLGLTGIQWTALCAIIALIGLFIILKGEILPQGCQKKIEPENNGFDSSFISNDEETPSRVDTVVLKPQEEKTIDTTPLPAKVIEKEPFDSTCAIFYLKGDSIAKEDAQATRVFLLDKKKVDSDMTLSNTTR